MRCFSKSKIFVLIGFAVLLLGLGGCSPGTIVWRLDDGRYAQTSPMSPMGKEATR